MNDIAAGRYADAEPLLRQALAIREANFAPNRPALGDSYYNLGWLYRLEGRYTEAEPLLRRSLAIMETAKGPDDPLVAQHLTELAVIYQNEGRYGDSAALLQRALSVDEKALGPDAAPLAIVLDDIGYLNRIQNHFAQAEPFYRRALAIRETAFGPDDPRVATVLTNLGSLLRVEGRDADAEPLIRRALAIREKAMGDDHPDTADSLSDLGNLYVSEHRYADARPLLERALAIWQTVLGPDSLTVALRGLSNVSRLDQAMGQDDAALATSTQAITILQRNLLVSSGRRSAAAVSERRVSRGEFLRNISLLYGGMARTPDAALDRSFEVAQLAAASTAGQAVASMAARFASGTDALAAEVRGLQDLDDKWHELDEAIVTAASRPSANRTASDEATLRRELDAVGRQLSEREANIARDFPAYADLTTPAPLPLTTARGLLRPDEAMLVYAIGEDESWLWALRRDRAALFRLPIGAASLAAEVSALRARLDPTRNPLMLPFPAQRSYALYEKILAPAGGLIEGARNVIVVPDGALESLPLSVLVTRPPRADPVNLADHRDVAWFAKDHAITVLPTVGSLRALRLFATRSRATLPFLGVGDPVLGGDAGETRSGGAAGGGEALPGLGRVLAPPIQVQQADLFRGAEVNLRGLRQLPPLPETALELRMIAHVLGTSDDTLYLGPRASEPVIRGAGMERYRIVEFATHGLMAGDLGLGEPALVLTPPPEPRPNDDGLLTASKIATMKLDADFVVLSACNTAASDGKPDAGGLTGLAQAFFYAGARSLLVSHWPVPSLATVMLTTTTFAELASDPAIGRAEALRRSMMAMMAPGKPPELSHPMAWAPFVLAGEGGRTLRE